MSENARQAGLVKVSPVRRRLVDQVITILEERLRSGEFEVGARFPSEPELMEQLGVGKTTVREAVRALGHSGLLSVRQGAGTYVKATTVTDRPLAQRLKDAQVLDVFAVRKALDLEMVRLAAQARTEADLTKLRSILRRMGDVAHGQLDPDEFSQASIDLHLAVAAATGNHVLMELYTSFTVALREAIREVSALPGVMEACLSRHERLVDALALQEPETAQAITRQHLDRTTRLLQQVLAPSDDQAAAGSDASALST